MILPCIRAWRGSGKALEFLVDQLDSKMLVYAAISPGMATGRYVHMRRIACDAFKNIDETAYTLNATSLGWWQHKGVMRFYRCGSCGVCGRQPRENRARLTSAIVTGTVITGDDYAEHSNASGVAQQLLQNRDVLEVAQLPNGFVPVDHHTGETPSSLFVHNSGGVTYLAVVNYNRKSTAFEADFGKLGLSSGEYLCKELFSGKTSTEKGKIHVTVDAADAMIFRLEKK